MFHFVWKALSFCTILYLISSSVGQTFQYSRGWTNGKRTGTTETSTSATAKTIATLINEKQIPLQLYGNLREPIYLMQRNNFDRTLERCLFQLHHFLRNPFLTQALQSTYDLIDATNNMHHSNNNNNNNNNNNHNDNDNDNVNDNDYDNDNDNVSKSNHNNRNNNDNLSYSSHHQSFDIYGKVGNDDIDSNNVYMKH